MPREFVSSPPVPNYPVPSSYKGNWEAWANALLVILRIPKEGIRYELNTVVLKSDVVNNNGVADTLQDVTDLFFPVKAGFNYWFRFSIPYTSAAATTGSRWSINGPAAPTSLAYSSRYTLGAAAETFNYLAAYNQPAAANATSLTAGNLAVMEGFIVPSVKGTVIARFASEIAGSAITAKAGAMLQWVKVL